MEQVVTNAIKQLLPTNNNANNPNNPNNPNSNNPNDNTTNDIIAKFDASLKALEQIKVTIVENVNAENKFPSDLIEKLKKINTNLNTFKEQIEKLKIDCNNNTAKFQENEAKIKELTEKINELNITIQNLETEKTNLRNNTEEKENEINKLLKSQAEQADTLADRYKSSVQTLQNENDSLKDKISKATTTITNLSAQLSEIQAKVNACGTTENKTDITNLLGEIDTKLQTMQPVVGGRRRNKKTKKRKQKGGFIYNTKSKRRSLKKSKRSSSSSRSKGRKYSRR